MVERVYGAKYEQTKGLRRAEISKLVRADIKAAVKAGELPAGKYSVTTRAFSGGGAIDIRISDLEIPFLHNPERLRFDLRSPHSCDRAIARYSPEATAAFERVEAILAAYSYDGSDLMADYFDVRFYGGVDFDSAWSNARKLEELDDLRAEDKIAAERAEVFADLAKVPAHVEYLAAMGVA